MSPPEAHGIHPGGQGVGQGNGAFGNHRPRFKTQPVPTLGWLKSGRAPTHRQGLAQVPNPTSGGCLKAERLPRLFSGVKHPKSSLLASLRDAHGLQPSSSAAPAPKRCCLHVGHEVYPSSLQPTGPLRDRGLGTFWSPRLVPCDVQTPGPALGPGRASFRPRPNVQGTRPSPFQRLQDDI